MGNEYANCANVVDKFCPVVGGILGQVQVMRETLILVD